MITLNADVGESFGIHTFGHDDELVKVIDIANVACGFHAGDPTTMRETIEKLASSGVRVGAHPGLPDLVGFGRREMRLDPDELTDIVRYQVGALVGFLDAIGVPLSHIKPHGALYGMTAREPRLMDGVCDVAAQYGVPVLGMPGTGHEQVADQRAVPFIAEFYVDLGYDDAGALVIERRPQATDPDAAAVRASLALNEGVVVTPSGRRLPVRVDSVCVHADTRNAIDVARAVRRIIDLGR